MIGEAPRVGVTDPDDAATLAALSADERRAVLFARTETLTQRVDVPSRPQPGDGEDS